MERKSQHKKKIAHTAYSKGRRHRDRENRDRITGSHHQNRAAQGAACCRVLNRAELGRRIVFE